MRKFLAKHGAAITGTLSCFDRLLFKGHLALGYDQAMANFLLQRGIPFTRFKPFVLAQAERLKTHARALAEQTGRPWEYFESPVRKDQRARAIAERDGITAGLVCVFSTVEPCRTFRLADAPGRPTLRSAWRKCLFLYFYFIDPEFGLLHVRLQTWFPFTIHVYVNGHEGLARQLDQRGVRYRCPRQRLPLARGSGSRAAARRSLRDVTVADHSRAARPPGESAAPRSPRRLSVLLGRAPGGVCDRRAVHQPRRATRPLRPLTAPCDALPARRGRPHVPRLSFDGWAIPIGFMKETSAVVAPRTWLAAIGWGRLGLIHPDERPAPARGRARQ